LSLERRVRSKRTGLREISTNYCIGMVVAQTILLKLNPLLSLIV
jgi:hypothetical protein